MVWKICKEVKLYMIMFLLPYPFMCRLLLSADTSGWYRTQNIQQSTKFQFLSDVCWNLSPQYWEKTDRKWSAWFKLTTIKNMAACPTFKRVLYEFKLVLMTYLIKEFDMSNLYEKGLVSLLFMNSDPSKAMLSVYNVFFPLKSTLKSTCRCP